MCRLCHGRDVGLGRDGVRQRADRALERGARDGIERIDRKREALRDRGAGAAGSERLFSFVVPPGQSFASFALSGGTGNADLFVSMNEIPSSTSADWQSAGAGTSEKIIVPNPSGGTAYVLVCGGASFGGVQLTANFGGWVHLSHVHGPWKNHLMGSCGVKLKDYGCMVACVAMALHRAGTFDSRRTRGLFARSTGITSWPSTAPSGSSSTTPNRASAEKWTSSVAE